MVLLSLNLAGQRQGRMSVLLHRTAFQRSMTRQSLPCVIESLWSAGSSYNRKRVLGNMSQVRALQVVERGRKALSQRFVNEDKTNRSHINAAFTLRRMLFILGWPKKSRRASVLALSETSKALDSLRSLNPIMISIDQSRPIVIR
jgi:hypothetical protein